MEGESDITILQQGIDSKLQQTLALIKPQAMGKVEEIINVIQREGFEILQKRRFRLSEEQASQFYQDAYNLQWYGEAVNHLSSGESLALVLSGPAAVEHFLEFLGPEDVNYNQFPNCLRARFGVNSVHGSHTEFDALRELHFFFPELIVEPLLADNLASYYLNENVHPVLTVGLSLLVRQKPEDPIIWLADWLLANNPNKPKKENC